MLNLGRLKQRELECKLDGNFLRAVSLRRIYLSKTASIPLNELPFMQYDYSYVSLQTVLFFFLFVCIMLILGAIIS